VLYGFDPASGLHLIAREGRLFEVAPGDLRTVSTILFAGNAGTGDGRPIGINNAGEVVFRLTFTDGSSGIFLTGVPEPAALLTLLGAFLILRRRPHLR
jgi:hypothetical protein